MCGIIGANRIPVSPERLLRTLYHRGPDHQEYVCKEGNFFGHTRLSIIDPHPEAHQPMCMEGVILVFNGEIYNFDALKREHHLECITRSDTEVIIRMYRRYGIKALTFFEGMFAFALYDEISKRWLCARDRFGKKPFYYHFANGIFTFSSEIKGVLALLESKPELNVRALGEYLMFQSPLGDRTFFDGVHKLPAGSYLVLEDGKLQNGRYYDLEGINTVHSNEEKVVSDIDTLLHRSVEKRLVGDVDVASLLSGGLDSSLVSALYARLSGRPIHTFSIGYEEHTQYCELNYAKEAATQIGSVHHELRIAREEYLDAIDEVLEHLDEPMSDSAAIPTYLLSKFVHQNGFKVCLSGEGSDESFLGYNHYFPILEKMEMPFADPGPFSLTKEWEYARRRFQNETLYRSAGETFTPAQLNRLFLVQPEWPEWDMKSSYSGVQWLTYVDFKIWIAEVLMTKVDRMSMAHSLELRAPFLDPVLVEYMMAVDPKLKRTGTTKALLKKAARPYLSDSIIHRPKKGFSSPYIEWIFEGHGEGVDRIIRDVNQDLGIFDDAFLRFLVNEGREGRFKQHVYALYLFARWYQKVYI